MYFSVFQTLNKYRFILTFGAGVTLGDSTVYAVMLHNRGEQPPRAVEKYTQQQGRGLEDTRVRTEEGARCLAWMDKKGES